VSEISKTYDPKAVEPKWYKFWLDNDLFRADPDSGKPPYCIMMPPPNITGELHMGHGLQDSIQDYLIRMKRMQGFEALWQPGADHAGIATQNVVEKSLANQGITRQQLGRERFVAKVWEWREKYGRRILQQKYMLGDSPDWRRERFTLDPGLSRAVAKVFAHLYDKGLIYRGNYIVNWCPRCHTAISDEEVEHSECDSNLWYFKYPLKDLNTEAQRIQSKNCALGVSVFKNYIIVATTRPETMLGDAAIAINPKDERLQHLIGRTVILPLVEREIPVIEDDFVDPHFGTGQVKVTPAHDPNDFDMGKRHNLPYFVIMDESGIMNENVPLQFRGMDRFKARQAVVEALKERGLLEKIEPYRTSIGHCSRCKTVIEPYISLQWFVRMKPLAEPALEVVRDGKIKFYPARWEKVYYSWLENVRDWCISRQLWWGHRIPVWYCQVCGELIVKEEAPDICPKCNSANLKQDEDVLDTWFSSWLWPFSTLGWPDNTKELEFWYPTDVLVSGYDIIFFWIARMIMAGLEFLGEIPYHTVYITGMIKDEQGRWMSKSLGNGIDPAEMVELYGADAVRFTLVTLATEGQDIKLTPSRFEGGRNFANKLWNAYRFLMTNADRLKTEKQKAQRENSVFSVPSVFKNLSDRWIVSRLHSTTEQAHSSAEKYRLYECLTTIYDFFWKEYCDWYLELLKGRLTPDTPFEEQNEAMSVALYVFEATLRLLHPGMPFITEEMWQMIRECRMQNAECRITPNSKFQIPNSIVNQCYPKTEDYPQDIEAEQEMDFVQQVITAIRTVRSEMRVPPDKKADVIIANCPAEKLSIIESNTKDIMRLSMLSNISFGNIRPPHSASVVLNEMEIYIPLEDLIDIELEKVRLEKDIARLQGLIKSSQTKLSSPNFIEKAPESVVEYERQKLEDCQTQLEAVARNMKALE